MLELSGVWDPPGSWSASQPGAMLGSRRDLLVRNKEEVRWYEENKTETWFC